jgi:hypothetical protein
VPLIIFDAVFVVAVWLFGFRAVALSFVLPLAVLLTIILFANHIFAAWNNLRKGHGTPPDVASGPEPAYRNYFFRNAMKDARCIVEQSTEANKTFLTEVRDATVLLIANPVFPLLYLVGIPIAITTAIAMVCAAAAAAAVIAAHLAIILLVCAAILFTAYLFGGAELAVAWVRRWFVVCPNSGCYKPVGLPLYRCPECGAEHKQLIPGEYGIFHRRCSCGKAVLGTLRMTGRAKLHSFCPSPDCGRPLPEGIEEIKSIHLLLTGAPNAGKTTLLAATVCSLARRTERGSIALQIPQTAQQRALRQFQEMMESHQYPGKTVNLPPDAFVSYLQDCRRRRAALYIYDPSGESFRDRRVLRGQNFQSIVSGLLFLVDPDVVLPAPSEPDIPGRSMRPEDADSVYARQIGVLRESKGRHSQIKDVAVAVVVTKADKLGVTARGDAREWLQINGQGNLVRSVEKDFAKVRYFFTSVELAEGESTSAARPAEWLLSELTELDLNTQMRVSCAPDDGDGALLKNDQRP